MMTNYAARMVAGALLIGFSGCAAAPDAMKTEAAVSEPTLEIAVPEGGGCYKANAGRDNMLRSHLIAMQQGSVSATDTVEAIKQSVVDGGFAFNQVPAAESAAVYALSGGDLVAWEQGYNDYAEPGETGRTTFLNSLCWAL